MHIFYLSRKKKKVDSSVMAFWVSKMPLCSQLCAQRTVSLSNLSIFLKRFKRISSLLHRATGNFPSCCTGNGNWGKRGYWWNSLSDCTRYFDCVLGEHYVRWWVSSSRKFRDSCCLLLFMLQWILHTSCTRAVQYTPMTYHHRLYTNALSLSDSHYCLQTVKTIGQIKQ